MDKLLVEIFNNFKIEGELLSIVELKVGHIHKTYISKWSSGRRFIHQLVNNIVFKDPRLVMNNIRVVTEHIDKIYRARNETSLTPLRIVATSTEEDLYLCSAGGWWRTYEYIENSRVINVCESSTQARIVGSVFGQFQKDLLSLPKGILKDSIPNFMNCGMRFEAFTAALNQDSLNRARGCQTEIDFVLKREQYFSVLDKVETLRPTHGDMKLNNILFSSNTGKPLCIVDLDTCMEGSYLFDFADMARVVCSSVGEEEGDTRLVKFRKDFFDTLLSGYTDVVGEILIQEEKDLLPLAPMVLALTVGTRFITDYLLGDTYFHVSYPANNLVRARNQLALAQQIAFAMGIA